MTTITAKKGGRQAAMADAQGPDDIFITTEEFYELIGLAGRNNLLDAGFGGGRAWLRRDPAGRVISTWALPHLAKMRGVDVTDIIGKARDDGAH